MANVTYPTLSTPEVAAYIHPAGTSPRGGGGHSESVREGECIANSQSASGLAVLVQNLSDKPRNITV